MDTKARIEKERDKYFQAWESLHDAQIVLRRAVDRLAAVHELDALGSVYQALAVLSHTLPTIDKLKAISDQYESRLHLYYERTQPGAASEEA